jgi:PmbA protein
LAERIPSITELATLAVDAARKAGATECDAYAAAFDESEVTVRKGATERVIEAGSRGLGLRAIVDGRTAICSTTDLRPDALQAFARETVELARISEPDEFAGLPAPGDLFRGRAGALGLFDEAVETLAPERMTELAMACESAAFDADSRISNSDGATLSRRAGEVALANSLGFANSYPATSVTLIVEVMADDADGKKRNAYWYTSARSLHRLEAPEEVGRMAAERAVAQLGARRLATKEMPVVFEPMAAATLLGNFAGCVVGGALYRRATFLADRAGLVLASPLVTIFDDPALPSGQGSRPFDGEGVAARRVPLITAGVFQGFLFDCYSARRTGATTTGSAGRSLEGAPSASPSNLSFQAGTTPASSIIEDVAEGLYVTQLMGAGFNPTTGDYSRGASGFFIENGRIAFPVTEVNISSRLDTMLAGVDAVGDDLHWFRSLAAPTIRVRSMTVSGL